MPTPTKYTFNRTPINSDTLTTEINASSIAKTLLSITVDGSLFDVWFDDVLSTAEKTTLYGASTPPDSAVGSVIGDHSGSAPIKTKFGASSGLFDTDIAITEDTTWQDLGGRRTNIQSLLSLIFGHTTMSRAIGRVPFRVKTSGTGTELRLVEIEEDGTVTSLMASAHVPGDTSSVWKYQSFNTDITPSVGDRLLCMQGRLNGATSAIVGEAAMTLLDVGI